MTEKKFLALLNLYLDGEIDPAGVTDLEREILTNPARKRVYSDYCRIHRATKMVCEQFRTAGDEQAAEGLRTFRQTVRGAPPAEDELQDRRTGGRATPNPLRRFLVVSASVAAAGAVIFAVAAALRPAESTQDLAASPSDNAAGTPAAALAASVIVSPAGGAFPAPFASGSRADPYVADLSPVRVSPFSLTSWSNEPERRNYGQGIWNEVTPQVVEPQFRPAMSDEMFSPVLERPATNASQRLFRVRSEERLKTVVEPLGFELTR